MPKGTQVEEYLVKITPFLDMKEYSKVMKDFEDRVTKRFGNIDKASNNSEKKTKAIAGNMANMGKSGLSLSKIISSAPGKLALVAAGVKIILEIMKKVVKAATDFSNKMITSSSAFVDKDTRNLMARFGVGSQTAAGIGSVTNLMGISPEDMKIMTPGQMELFSDLMKQWTDGMNSIDKSKLDKFNQVMQDFQKDLASAKLELQLKLYEMLVELGPSLEVFFDGIISVIKIITDLLTSPIVKAALELFFYVVGGILQIVSFLVNLLSGGLLGDGLSGAFAQNSLENSKSNSSNNSYSNVTTYNMIDTTTNNSFTGDTNTMFDLASNITEQNNQYIKTQYWRDGRV